MFFKTNKKIIFTLGITAIVLFWAFYQFRWIGKNGEEWKHILWSDARGYYYYLPSVFIHGDLDNQPFDPLYTVINDEGRLVNRYYIGTSLLEAPFFLIAYIHSALVGAPIDGTSQPFAFWIGVCPIIYVLTGLFYLYRLLRQKNLDENFALFLIIIASLGTNLFFYTVYKGNFSHAFSFFLISRLLYKINSLNYEKMTIGKAFDISFTGIIIFLVRPVNVLILFFLPSFFKSFASFLEKFIYPFFTIKNFVLCISTVLPFIFLQLLVWHKQTGHWIQWSYNQEGFYFLNPKIFSQLLSFDMGLFIYNPVFLIAFLICIFGILKWKYETKVQLFFLLIFSYVLASWWSPTYGNSFSIRPYTDITAIMILFLTPIFTFSKLKIRLLMTILVFCGSLNLLYSYQFYKEIIPGTGMNKERFFEIFGKTGNRYKNCFGGMYDLPPYAPNGFKELYHYNKFEFEKKSVNCFNYEFPVGTEFIYPSNFKDIRHVWIKIDFEYLIPKTSEMNDALMVFDITDTVADTNVYYFTFKVKDFKFEKKNILHHHTFTVWFPNLIHAKNRVKMYVWNKEKENFTISKFDISLLVPRQ